MLTQIEDVSWTTSDKKDQIQRTTSTQHYFLWRVFKMRQFQEQLEANQIQESTSTQLQKLNI